LAGEIVGNVEKIGEVNEAAGFSPAAYFVASIC